MNPILRALAEKYREHFKPMEPHVGEILDSRIVDHNLDVADPPNGWYVRYANGLQECFKMLTVNDVVNFRMLQSANSPWAAPFSNTPIAPTPGFNTRGTAYPFDAVSREDVKSIFYHSIDRNNVRARIVQDGSGFFKSGDSTVLFVYAIGSWEADG